MEELRDNSYTDLIEAVRLCYHKRTTSIIEEEMDVNFFKTLIYCALQASLVVNKGALHGSIEEEDYFKKLFSSMSVFVSMFSDVPVDHLVPCIHWNKPVFTHPNECRTLVSMDCQLLKDDKTVILTGLSQDGVKMYFVLGMLWILVHRKAFDAETVTRDHFDFYSKSIYGFILKPNGNIGYSILAPEEV